MATLTNDQLAALQFGYITGADLMAWCAPQLLISRNEINSNLITDGVATAYSEVINSFKTKYNIISELQKISSPREATLVKIIAIFAVRNILGNLQNIGEAMTNNFKWADQTCLDIRDGQMNISVDAANLFNYSGSFMVGQKFSTLG